jgi:hypothetical protein
MRTHVTPVVLRPGARPQQDGRARSVRITRLLAAVALVTALGGAAFGLHVLEPVAQRVANPQPRLEWVGLPAWLTHPNQAAFLAQREADAGLGPHASVHDPVLVRSIGERLAASPWIAEVRRVAARSNGQIRVHALFRTPLAMVEHRGTALLVDQSGVRLPLAMPAQQVNRHDWLVIQGVAASPPAEAGQPWAGEDLAAGLKLARFLAHADAMGRLPFRPAIHSIDVSNHKWRVDGSAGQLRLRLAGACDLIHWGVPPGEEYEIEPSAEWKLAALSDLHQSGRLPSGRQVDVRDRERVLFYDCR